MHLSSEKDVWCRWRSVTLWQVELLFLLFHQWCCITGLQVSSPFWCEKTRTRSSSVELHTCIHTWMDLHLFWPKAYFHIIRKAGRSIVSSERLAFIFHFLKTRCHLHHLTVNTVFDHLSTEEMFSFLFSFPPLLSRQRAHTSPIAAASGDTVTWINNRWRPTG